jgi:hypothetical protein
LEVDPDPKRLECGDGFEDDARHADFLQRQGST